LRKRAVVVFFVLVSSVLVIAGTLFVRLAEANPYWWYTAVPPDGYTKPPVILIFFPENNSVY
jgi:hypothetical protein